MEYGKGPVAGGSGVALLPATGDNALLFTLAIGLIALGVAVMIASMLVARKSRQGE